MDRINKYFPEISTHPENQLGLLNVSRLRSFFLAFFQFCLVLFITKQYNFEKSSGVIEYAPYILIAFLVHSFIQIRFRPAFLFLCCVSLIYVAFGLQAGSFMVFVGLSLIFICHLSINFNLRLFLILIVVILLVIFRTEYIYVPWMAVAIMYLAPLFMFRLIVYLYEIKTGQIPSNKWQSLTYFFLFPNVFFLFFPIVDHKTAIKTYYEVKEKEIWQKGIRWMLRGLIHIMCYRLICFNVLITQESVQDLPSLLHYMVANYSLILRISAIFHFAIGMICMFGYNLPQVFDNYFTATSFVDLWRRINIYWRDFVLKVFFYPIMFKYKKRIKKNLLAITMMTVFVITWLLHSYQLFWITSEVSIKYTDIIFWLIIGACITINSVVIERRSLSGKIENVDKEKICYLILTMLKIIGMFLFMSVMWSLWYSRTIEDWFYIIAKGKIFTGNQFLEILLIVIGVLVLGVVLMRVLKNKVIQQLVNKKPHETVLLTVCSLFLLVLFSFKEVQTIFPLASQNVLTSLTNGAPNLIEKENVEHGYYDLLIEGDEGNTIGIGSSSFKSFFVNRPYANAYYYTNDIMYRRMKANLKIDGIDHDFASNTFGIRDKNYSLIKPSGTYRMALLGGSYQMGSGVNNNQVFEAIVEERINKEEIDSSFNQLEIFNFAAGGYYLLQQVELVNTTIFKYDLNGVIYFAHTDEKAKVIHFFANTIKRKVPINYPFLKHIQEVSGAKSYMSLMQIKELLMPYADIIMKWGYKEIADKCKANNVIPIWGYMETTTEFVNDKEYYELKAYAESLGFVILDLRNTYGTIDRKDVQLSEWNTHPNVLGQKLIAEKFYKELMRNKSKIFTVK